MARRISIVFVLAAWLISAARPDENAAARPYWRTIVQGTHGMVAAEHPLETMAGLEALQAGGNAFDAALAVFYMTAVVEQHQAGLGGDCFVLAYVANEKRVVFFNGTGPAPRLATLDAYRNLGGIPFTGPYAVSVPGAVAGFEMVWKKYGTLKHAALVRSAIAAAASGHPLTEWSATNYEEALPILLKYPTSVCALLPGGKPPPAGDLFQQPDLARTLRQLSEGGADAFYRGALGKAAAETYQKAGGLIRFEDFQSFDAEQSEPIHANYKGYDVYESAPNSQGIVLLMALNILEGIDLNTMGHNSPTYLHTVTEALKLAFADRDYYIGDPRFVKNIPVGGLLSKPYAAERRKLIHADRAIQGMAPPGDPIGIHGVLTGTQISYEESQTPIRSPANSSDAHGETSSFSIADRFGNLVSVTHSVNGTFGSGIVVQDAGFVLNDRLPCFYLEEGNVNVLVPGKRTRHTISPALALKDGKPFLAWNTPGGDNQPQALLQAFLNVVEFGMNVQQALEAPTVISTSFHDSTYPHPVAATLTLPRILAAETVSALAAKGHRIIVTELQKPYGQQPSGAGGVKMVRIDPKTGIFAGGVSPAKDDYVMGW